MTRILVVEDNTQLANLIRSFFEFENHTVDILLNGTDGLASILSQPYDLVILDWEPGNTETISTKWCSNTCNHAHR